MNLVVLSDINTDDKISSLPVTSCQVQLNDSYIRLQKSDQQCPGVRVKRNPSSFRKPLHHVLSGASSSEIVHRSVQNWPALELASQIRNRMKVTFRTVTGQSFSLDLEESSKVSHQSVVGPLIIGS